MKLIIFKVLQMLAKSEFLGHVSLSEGLVFWSLQKSSLKSRCGECRSCWEVASHYVGSVLQKRAWSPAGNCHHIFSVIKDQNTNNSCFTSAGILAQTCEAMMSVETSPRVGQPSVVDGTWRDPITLQGKLGSALRTAAGPPLESVPCLAPGKLP